MAKLNYDDKITVKPIVDRSKQATAPDFNEIKESVNFLYDGVGYLVLSGEATGGTNESVVDSTQTWTVDKFKDKNINLKTSVGDFERVVLSNTATEIFFTTIDTNTDAEVIIGSGVNPEGQVTINAIGLISGEAGNDWEIHLEADDQDTATDYVDVDTVNKIIKITVDTDGVGNPRNLMAGNLQTLINIDVTASQYFYVEDGFTAGNLPYGAKGTPDIHSFSGGIDGDSIIAGDEYFVIISSAYDQSLNTTDNVEFASVTLTGATENSSLRTDGNGKIIIIKNNFSGGAVPIATDNASEGYSVGSVWYYNDEKYVLVSFTGTDANWSNSTVEADDLGSMAVQNSNTVAITGGTIDGTTIGSTTPSAGTFTTVTCNVNNVGYTITAGEELTGGKIAYFKAADSKYYIASCAAIATCGTKLVYIPTTIANGATGLGYESYDITVAGTAGDQYLSTAGAWLSTIPLAGFILNLGNATATVFQFRSPNPDSALGI